MAYITKTSGPGAYATGDMFDGITGTGAEAGPFDSLTAMFNKPAVTTTPSGPSAGDKLLGWLSNTASQSGTNTLTNIVRGQTGTAQQIAPVAQPTNYLPYIALGGVAIAAVLILKKKKG